MKGFPSVVFIELIGVGMMVIVQNSPTVELSAVRLYGHKNTARSEFVAGSTFDRLMIYDFGERS